MHSTKTNGIEQALDMLSNLLLTAYKGRESEIPPVLAEAKRELQAINAPLTPFNSGYVEFTRDGKTERLQIVGWAPTQNWILCDVSKLIQDHDATLNLQSGLTDAAQKRCADWNASYDAMYKELQDAGFKFCINDTASIIMLRAAKEIRRLKAKHQKLRDELFAILNRD